MNGVTTAPLSPVKSLRNWIVGENAYITQRDGKTLCTFTRIIHVLGFKNEIVFYFVFTPNTFYIKLWMG